MGFNLKAKAGVGQTGISPVAQFDVGPGLAEYSRKNTVIDAETEIAKLRAGFGNEPTCDPCLSSRKSPRGGQFYVEEVGVVFVHLSGESKSVQSAFAGGKLAGEGAVPG
jgi:hypothetical protein